MSASEKLRALNEQNYTGPTAREESIGLALSAALPQIVAVIEAAELIYMADRNDIVYTFKPLRDALAALEEALELRSDR